MVDQKLYDSVLFLRLYDIVNFVIDMAGDNEDWEDIKKEAESLKKAIENRVLPI